MNASEASAAAEAYMEAVLKAAAEAPKERKEQVADAYREFGGFKLEALALKDTDYTGLDEFLTGPTALGYSEDPVAAAKAVVEGMVAEATNVWHRHR